MGDKQHSDRGSCTFSPSKSKYNMPRSGSPLAIKRDSSSLFKKNRSISVLEHNLTYHVRKTLKNMHAGNKSEQNTMEEVNLSKIKKQRYLKRLSFIGYCLSLLSCLSAGSVMIISLYSATWLNVLNYNSFQINLISSAINMGAYIIPPFLGVICDTHGPVMLSLLSFFTFVPHYYFLSTWASIPIDQVKIFGFIVYCSSMIGCGTSSLYFASFISCSRLFTESKMLSISMPTTLYGSSSILFAYAATHWKKLRLQPMDSEVDFNETLLNLRLVFKYMAIFYSIVITLNYFATAIVTHLKLEYEEELQKDDENLPLLNHQNTNNTALFDDDDDEDVVLTDSDENMTETRYFSADELKSNEAESLNFKIRKFFTNKKTLLIFIVVFLSVGCLETFVSNMAAISELYSSEGNYYSPQIILSNFSLFSTAVRFFVGVVVDLATKKFGKRSKNLDIYLMMLLLLLGFFSQLVMHLSSAYLNLVSGIMGMSYGGLFTIFPIITLNHYDSNIFAIAYGCFLLAPAAGTPLFSLIFANIFDKNQCLISNFSFSCINSMFLVSAFAFAACFVISVAIILLGQQEEANTHEVANSSDET